MGVATGGEFTAAEASTKNGTLICRMRNIHDLTGIEHFIGLTWTRLRVESINQP